MTINLNDFDTALDLLEPTAKNMGAERLAWMKADPDFDALREVPRFKAMVAAAEARLAAEKG